MKRHTTVALAATTSISVLLALAACSTGSGAPGSTGAPGPVSYMTPDGECATSPLDGIDFDGSRQIIDDYSQVSAGLLNDEPLPTPADPGTVVAFLNNASPVAGLMLESVQRAAEVAGVTVMNIDTGSSAQSINSAMNSVVALAPDIVIAEALDATFFQDQLAALEAAGTAIVYGSQPGGEEFGLDESLGGTQASIENGRLLGAGAINFTCGTATQFVVYNMPEVQFSSIMVEGARDYLSSACPQCALRVVDISITDASPADKIVSDLQAHPETEYFITPADQFQVGLAEKASLVGIPNAFGFGHTSLPINVQQLADGTQNAGFAVDLDMYMWMQFDEGLRKAQGVFEPYDDWVRVTQMVGRVLTPANAGDYPGGVFVAQPDLAEQYAKLWRG